MRKCRQPQARIACLGLQAQLALIDIDAASDASLIGSTRIKPPSSGTIKRPGRISIIGLAGRGGSATAVVLAGGGSVAKAFAGGGAVGLTGGATTAGAAATAGTAA
ncbi:hypothetical protein Pstr01_00210 [Pseudomonas straminea]|nr:hypothetical protein Pstr01_00210 [Pseudomonas straminea]